MAYQQDQQQHYQGYQQPGQPAPVYSQPSPGYIQQAPVAHDPHYGQQTPVAHDPAHYAQQMPMQVQQPAQPVQQVMGGEWQHSLCDCSPCESCLLGWCLPCLLVGQTSERLRDPSMQTAEMLNNDCLIHGGIQVFTGCGWIYAMMKRTEIRERFGIPGSEFSDCCTTYWCHCCAVIQADNEVKKRLQPGPVQQGYQPQQGMVMPQTKN